MLKVTSWIEGLITRDGPVSAYLRINLT